MQNLASNLHYLLAGYQILEHQIYTSIHQLDDDLYGALCPQMPDSTWNQLIPTTTDIQLEALPTAQIQAYFGANAPSLIVITGQTVSQTPHHPTPIITVHG